VLNVLGRADTTASWAADMVRRLNGEDKAKALLSGRVQCVKFVATSYADASARAREEGEKGLC
jgi:hypothetical protein